MDLNAVETFVQVVDSGSFSAAARHLRVPKSTVSRRIARLEGELDVRLLQRTTRRMRPTPEGQRFYDRVSRAIGDMNVAAADVRDDAEEPRGLVRITAPTDLATTILPPILTALIERYPKLRLDVDSSGRLVDLVAEGFDLAMRAGKLEDSSLIARHLTDAEVWVLASPTTIERHGNPALPADLASLPCVRFRGAGEPVELHLCHHSGRTADVTVDGPLGGGDMAFVRHTALVGGGFAALPSLSVWQDVECGRLVRVLPDWSVRLGRLHLVYPSSRQLPARVRAVRDFVLEWFHPKRPGG